MRRLRFLLTDDYLRLGNLLEERFQTWMKDWTLSSDLNVQISRSSIDNFDIKKSKYLYKHDQNQESAYFIDNEFNWNALVFDNYYDDCPKDELLSQLMPKIRESFFIDVFGFSQTKNTKYVPSKNGVFRDSILINVTVLGIGAIQLLTQESQLHSMLNTLTRKSTPGVLSRFDAIKDMKIIAKVSANFGEIAFLDLVNLDVNKLVHSSKEIANQFELKISERSICNVALGKIGTSKSIIVKGVEK